MYRALRSEIARPIVQRLEAAGFDVGVIPLAGRPKGTWQRREDMPGLRLEAAQGGWVVASCESRDWSRERMEIEAACLLSHKVGVAVHADEGSAVRRRVA